MTKVIKKKRKVKMQPGGTAIDSAANLIKNMTSSGSFGKGTPKPSMDSLMNVPPVGKSNMYLSPKSAPKPPIPEIKKERKLGEGEFVAKKGGKIKAKCGMKKGGKVKAKVNMKKGGTVKKSKSKK